MAFRKNQIVFIVFPPTQINSSMIYHGEIVKIEGPKGHQSLTVYPRQAGMGALTFSGLTGRGLGTPAFIVESDRFDWALKQLTNP